MSRTIEDGGIPWAQIMARQIQQTPSTEIPLAEIEDDSKDKKGINGNAGEDQKPRRKSV